MRSHRAVSEDLICWPPLRWDGRANTPTVSSEGEESLGPEGHAPCQRPPSGCTRHRAVPWGGCWGPPGGGPRVLEKPLQALSRWNRAALVMVMVTPWVPRRSALEGERLREGCMCVCKGVLVSPPPPRLDLVPINRSVGLKAKPSKPVTEVLRPVAAKYGLRLSELVARLVSDQADGVTGPPVL